MPMSAADKAYALSQSTFLDPDYVNNLPAPCITYGQTRGAPVSWTITVLTPPVASQYQVQFYEANSGYWMLDVPGGESPSFTITVPAPTPQTDGSIVLSVAPTLNVDKIYRLAIAPIVSGVVESHGDFSAPLDTVIVVSGVTPPTNVKVIK